MKIIISLIFIPVMFTFFPQENRMLLSHLKFDQVYGELTIYKDDQQEIRLVKNSSLNNVKYIDQMVPKGYFLNLSVDTYFQDSMTNFIFPSIMGVLIDSSRQNDQSRGLISIDGSAPFTPGKLKILTDADVDTGLIYLGFLFALIGFLAGLTVVYDSESRTT